MRRSTPFHKNIMTLIGQKSNVRFNGLHWRLAFEVAVGLILLAALGLTHLVLGLRKY